MATFRKSSSIQVEETRVSVRRVHVEDFAVDSCPRGTTRLVLLLHAIPLHTVEGNRKGHEQRGALPRTTLKFSASLSTSWNLWKLLRARTQDRGRPPIKK